ncbi:aspartate kinase [Arthrobacter sp. FW305-BF8]|uniref:aspartate kinase n=1 Tax=Arthrobacter sp. FW305-BF8 TaxID=2879617 RepID=UPI001F015782|nr:aspartate kinase [Arthrobacter sp. FW305-BF8]UKA56487.1 aspartate kinase [Arthrobacter sp. FW305-BF8]
MPRGSLIVQKFGGSSVADAAGICRAARRIAKTREAGYQVVAVVSAMGDTTDQLCDLAAGVSQNPNPGALDALLSMGEAVSSSLLAMALVDCGQAARTFTGSQAGLITDSVHGKARITDVRPGRIRTCLDHDTVPIVAGFQGRTQKGRRVTTLGRGGSDLTAVALAAALGAGICEIYTDVDGVYTADPRIVPTARKIAALSSEEMLEFSACGSKVMHLRSVEYARRFGLPLHVRSSFTDEMGTLILPGLDRSPFQRPAPEQAVITEVSGCEALAEITVAGLPDDPESMSALFRTLSQSVTIQSVVEKRPGPARRADVVFSLPALQAATALSVLRAQQSDLDFQDLQHNGRAGKVMLSGLGMRSSPAVFSTFFSALSKARVDLDLIEISETGLSALTGADQLETAVRAVRSAFGLAMDGVGKVSGGVRLAATRGPRPGGVSRPETSKDGRRSSSPVPAPLGVHTL